MRRQVAAFTLIASLGVLFLTRCNNTRMSSGQQSGAQTGTVALMGGDAPVCDVEGFQVTITSATLTLQGGGSAVPIIFSSSPVTVDFARLMGFDTALTFTSVEVGTYSQLNLTLSNPVITYLDVTQTPPKPVTTNGTFASTGTATATVIINLNPVVNVMANQAAGIQLDFNLRKSLVTDATGQVTGIIIPVFAAGQAPPGESDGLGELADLHGIVQGVTLTSSNPSFTGSFSLQVRAGTGQIFNVNVTDKTEFDDLPGLGGLQQGTFVDVNAFVDSGGNIVAREVEAEEEMAPSVNSSAFLGRVITVTRDASGNATQFTLLVLEEYPDVGESIPLRSGLVVNVLPATTTFAIRAGGANEASLTFDATNIGLGEELGVHGPFQTNPLQLNADRIVLRRRPLIGHFNALLAAQSDDMTGGFTMTPCASIFQGKQVAVLTFGDTKFVGLSGLSALDAKPNLLTRGLLTYEQNSITVNGVTTAAPTWVDEAKVVRQLPD